jgi:putative two-component system response regulator
MTESLLVEDRETILVVDDTPENLTLMSALLKDIYRLKIANNGERALKIAQGKQQPDLILLDIMMPGLSGYDVCRKLKEDPLTKDIPVIFLTAMTSIADEEKGFELGAVDYITKPISPPIVLARVKTHLRLKASTDYLKNNNAFLEQEVRNRMKEISAIQDVTILAMAALMETRDNDTGNHIRRTQFYVLALANKLKKHPRFLDYLTEEQIKVIFKSAPLHDIGKVGIPDHILLKPGSFSEKEFEIMKTHTTLGRDAIEHAEKQLGMKVNFLSCAKEIAYGHQEKWDGSGYPEGLIGDQIPIPARLMAIADVYDALISKRVYKDGMSHEKAVAIIVQGRGTHFDPDVTDAFIEVADEFRQIANELADHHE